MTSLERNKSFNSKSVKKPVFLSPQFHKRTTIQSPNFLAELEANQRFLKQRDKLGYAEKRKSMSLGDLPLKELGFFEKITAKLSKSKSMSVKHVDQNNLLQKYRNREPEEKEFEKYQQERVENRSPTPKFPVVPEVQLRKSNSLKPNRGSSRSNTIHIVHTNPNRTEKDILISGPLKLTWLNTGLIENIERGAVVYRNGMLEIRYDANKPRIEMKMNSTMKNNKIWEFYNPDQNIRVSVDRQHQITMGSPRERRKSVEEESPKNMNKQNLLIKLLRRRSDKQLLEKKGIFKNEDIFGNKLSVLYDNSKAEVHEFVRRAVELIETDKNIKSEHIYRLSGNMATIQKIRLKIDGKNYRVLDEYKNDVDVLTGCLKLFFRELVEPLIPFKTFEELHKLTGKAAGPERDKSVKAVVKSMKTPHRENLQFLIHHLLIVESYKQFNKMTVQSLSIVWGPSMLWYPGVEKCPAYSPYEFSMLVNGVLELILMTYQTDFDSNLQTLSKNVS